MAKIVTSPPHY